jgi:hypothetical protein
MLFCYPFYKIGKTAEADCCEGETDKTNKEAIITMIKVKNILLFSFISFLDVIVLFS